jgi:dihydroorotate dehydrogenase
MEGLVLRGINFGVVFVASGALNFFGEGWFYHPWYKLLFSKGFDFRNTTFISKTTTFFPRAGNMPLNNNLQPKNLFPDCTRVYFRKAMILNSVGLSGPGALNLLERKKWQTRTDPFMISFMSLGDSLEQKCEETKLFVDLLLKSKLEFQSSFGIQVNVSCPNTKYLTEGLIKDVFPILEIFKPLYVPLDLKIGVVDALNAGTDFVKEIENSGLCDCLTCSNTIPWGKLPERINWQKLFGTNISPLKHLGGGGLSGRPLKPIVLDWLKSVRSAGVLMPIKAGGGILSREDVREYVLAGASALEIGSVAPLRPWNLQSIIGSANIMLAKW